MNQSGLIQGVIYIVELTETANKSINNLPDGPNTPKSIQTFQTIFQPVEYLEKAVKDYGDIFTMRILGFPPVVSLSHPQAIQTIFKAEHDLFDTGRNNWIAQPFLGDNSVMLLDGMRHQQQRKLLMPSFHGARMQKYGKVICDITEQVIHQWIIGQRFSMYLSVQEISRQAIMSIVFGLERGERCDLIMSVLSSLLKITNSSWKFTLLWFQFPQHDLGNWSPWGNFLHQKKLLNQLLTDEICQRKTNLNSSSEDILSLMLSAHDEEGNPMSESEIRDELITLIFARETTASAIAWAFYWIHAQPEVYSKLMEELEYISLDTEPSVIAKLPYLSAVVSESLRISPVGLFTFVRALKTPLKVMGYHFEPGTLLAPCIYLTHHRSDIYPEPMQFKPERFLEHQFSPYEYFPFGGGNRRCIGYAFALFEIKLVLATILKRVHLELATQRPVQPIRHGVAFTPSGGTRMVVKSIQRN
ncbi:MAG: cytochrome P450 [Dolichospermum sp. DET73]|nr:cytochrome P450 [Dolichospermum sp. DET73]